VSYSFILFIEVDRVVHIELSHELGEILLGYLYHQVIVVRHEAVVM